VDDEARTRFRARAKPSPGPFPQLTERGREILDLIAAGHNNTAIATRLRLSPKTVRNHISNIFAKLRFTDRAQAIVEARTAGLGLASRSRAAGQAGRA